MPQLQVTTKTADRVWASPDGQRVIYKLTLDYKGSEVTAKTYSQSIATVGWSGTVETYEKSGSKGIETFVKQPPKEGGFIPQQQGSRQSGFGAGGSRPDSNNFTMYLSYVKDIAVALIAADRYSLEQLAAITREVGDIGEALYDMRPDNPDNNKETSTAETAIESVFGNGVVTEEEQPWSPETDEEIPIVADEPPQLPVS